MDKKKYGGLAFDFIGFSVSDVAIMSGEGGGTGSGGGIDMPWIPLN